MRRYHKTKKYNKIKNKKINKNTKRLKSNKKYNIGRTRKQRGGNDDIQPLLTSNEEKESAKKKFSLKNMLSSKPKTLEELQTEMDKKSAAATESRIKAEMKAKEKSEKIAAEKAKKEEIDASKIEASKDKNLTAMQKAKNLIRTATGNTALTSEQHAQKEEAEKIAKEQTEKEKIEQHNKKQQENAKRKEEELIKSDQQKEADKGKLSIKDKMLNKMKIATGKGELMTEDKKREETAKNEAEKIAKKEADAKKKAESNAKKQAKKDAKAAKKGSKGNKLSNLLGNITSGSSSGSSSGMNNGLGSISEGEINTIAKEEAREKVAPLQNWGVTEKDIPKTDMYPDVISPNDPEALADVQKALKIKYELAMENEDLAKKLKHIRDNEELSTIEEIGNQIAELPGVAVKGYIDFWRAMILGFKNQMLSFQKTSETQVLNAETLAKVSEERAKKLGVKNATEILQEGGADNNSNDIIEKSPIDIVKEGKDEINNVIISKDNVSDEQKKAQEKAANEYANEFVEKNKKILITILEKVMNYLLMINVLKKMNPEIKDFYDIPLEKLKNMLKETAPKEVREELKEKKKLLTEHVKKYVEDIVEKEKDSIIENSKAISDAELQGYMDSLNMGLNNIPMNYLSNVLGTLGNAAISPAQTALTEQMAPFVTAANSYTALNSAITNNLSKSEQLLAAQDKKEEDILNAINSVVVPSSQSGGKKNKTKRYKPLSFIKMNKTKRAIKRKKNKILKSVEKFTQNNYKMKSLYKKFKKCLE